MQIGPYTLNEESATFNMETDVRKLIQYLDKITKAEFKRLYPNVTVPHYTIDKGRRYWRIVTNSGQRSVWGFVDATTGDVLKAASWKAPAKHARGHISDQSTWKSFTWTGPGYLR